MKATQSTVERFRSRLVSQPNGCIEYSGARLAQGYGTISIGKRSTVTHRLAWFLAHGPIRDGMHVCHTCDNPPCCNVDHLFLGTRSDNMQDMARKGRSWQAQKTHCPRDHEYTPENTRVLKNGGRACRECKRLRTKGDTAARTANRRARIRQDRTRP